MIQMRAWISLVVATSTVACLSSRKPNATTDRYETPLEWSLRYRCVDSEVDAGWTQVESSCTYICLRQRLQIVGEGATCRNVRPVPDSVATRWRAETECRRISDETVREWEASGCLYRCSHGVLTVESAPGVAQCSAIEALRVAPPEGRTENKK